MLKAGLWGLLTLAMTSATAQADPVTDSGAKRSNCTTVSECLARGYVLRTTTSYTSIGPGGTEWVTVAHFLQDGTRLIACSVSFARSQAERKSFDAGESRCVAPDW